MANESKCSFQNMLDAILGTSSSEQNFAYSPLVYQNQYNTVTSLLISKCAREYPSNNQLIDIIAPFVRVVKIPVTDGFIDLERYKEYRNLLGSPYVNLAPDGKPCGDNTLQETPKPYNSNTFKTANLRGGCNVTPIVIKSQDEFAYLSSSEYAYPTQKEPIGYFADNFKIKVCPYDLPTATVMYIVEEPTYLIKYIVQPDDTYILDPTNPIASDWTSAAFTPFYTAMLALYSAYIENPELTNFAQILHERGIL